MTALTDYARLTRGLSLLRDVYEIDQQHPNAVELVSRAAHVFEATASAWLTAARSWFSSGNTDALEEAEDLPLDTLIAISRAIYKADPEIREKLRTTLTSDAHGKTPEQVRAHAKQKLKETVTATVTNTMTISHEADVMGMKHAHLRLREEQMNELQARALNATSLNRNEPVAVRLADGLLTLLSGTSPDYSDHFNRSLVPAIMLTLDNSTYIGDGKFATTDGQIIDSKNLGDYTLAPYGFLCIYDSTGHIGIEYELKNLRFATGHLRNAVTLDQIFCAHPGCHELAQYSQFHHIAAVADGGETTSDNIIPLCKRHNTQNDDHKERNKNGWHGRHPITGEAGYNPPGSDEWMYNGHPATAYSGRALHLRQRKMREKERRKAKKPRTRGHPPHRKKGRLWL